MTMIEAAPIADQETIFGRLAVQPADPLLSIIAAFRGDPRPHKIDLGVGVYRDDTGRTPVLLAVKAAEGRLVAAQDTKAYIGVEGNGAYLARLKDLIFGASQPGDLVAMQTPGGTGAIRLAAELIQASSPGARIWIGEPSWPVHVPLSQAAGLRTVTYRYFDPVSQCLLVDEIVGHLERAERGDIVLLHGCCHNPTGADPNRAQWRQIAEVILRRGLIPFIDLAYHGLGVGLAADLECLRALADCPQLLLAYSCSKNFGLYRERVGALFVRTGSAALNQAVASTMFLLGRMIWSMPPDHGAAVVAEILSSDDLSQQWQDELGAMRHRLSTVRAEIAREPGLAMLGGQHGMFSQLSLTPAQVDTLRRDRAIYMAGSGRINLAGLATRDVPRFVDALKSVGALG
jgi:aromatic-amino-acid transaminase